MPAFKNVMLSLVRPDKGLPGAANTLKWLWMPLVLLLVTSVAIKAAVATPMSIEANQRFAEQQMTEVYEDMPEEERKFAEEERNFAEEAAIVDEELMGENNAVVSTAAMVFAVAGAIGAVLYVAVFFFVAARTWASSAGFATILSVVALSFVPRALGNFVRAAYMAVTGTWLQHSGLGAMVAPGDTMYPSGAAYAILSQVDVWALWGLAILFGALVSAVVGFDRKRAIVGMAVFLVVTVAARAVPTFAAGAFMGAM